MKKKRGRITLSDTAPFIALIIIYGGLELVIKVFNISRTVLPSPTSIIYTLITNFTSDFLYHSGITIYTILIGMIIGIPCGIVFAALVSQFKLIEASFSPYIIMLVTTPMITLVPLMMTWIGFGEKARIIVVICQVIPIVTLNSITGFNSIEKDKLNLAASLGATKIQTFVKVIFPNAWSYVFTGMRLGGIFATVAAVAAELAGAPRGLGNRVVYYSRFIETEMSYSAILLIALIGITIFMTISQVEKKIVVWKKY